MCRSEDSLGCRSQKSAPHLLLETESATGLELGGGHAGDPGTWGASCFCFPGAGVTSTQPAFHLDAGDLNSSQLAEADTAPPAMPVPAALSPVSRPAPPPPVLAWCSADVYAPVFMIPSDPEGPAEKSPPKPHSVLQSFLYCSDISVWRLDDFPSLNFWRVPAGCSGFPAHFMSGLTLLCPSWLLIPLREPRPFCTCARCRWSPPRLSVPPGNVKAATRPPGESVEVPQSVGVRQNATRGHFILWR